MQERVGCTEQTTVSDRATNDLAQNIPPAFIRRQYSIRDQECGGARMVGDNTKRCGDTRMSFAGNLLVERYTGQVGSPFQQKKKKVVVVIRYFPLKHRR